MIDNGLPGISSTEQPELVTAPDGGSRRGRGGYQGCAVVRPGGVLDRAVRAASQAHRPRQSKIDVTHVPFAITAACGNRTWMVAGTGRSFESTDHRSVAE